jgi:hypothetical protein
MRPNCQSSCGTCGCTIATATSSDCAAKPNTSACAGDNSGAAPGTAPGTKDAFANNFVGPKDKVDGAPGFRLLRH